MLDKMKEIKKDLCKYGKLIIEKGLAVGPGGNISARLGETVYLSPSGFALDEIKEKDWVAINLDSGKTKEGKLRPTCEVSMHLGCYLLRKDIKAVIHTHSPFLLGLISAGGKLKPFFPDFVALLGKEVPIAEYVIPAGEEIRKAVTKIIKNHNAVLLKNHGAVTVGINLKEAFFRAQLLEETAKIIIAGKITGKLKFFTKKEIQGIDNLAAEDYRRVLLKDS